MKLFVLFFLSWHSLNPVRHHHKSFKNLPDKWHDRMDTLRDSKSDFWLGLI